VFFIGILSIQGKPGAIDQLALGGRPVDRDWLVGRPCATPTATLPEAGHSAWFASFMHFCDSNHEILQMQHEEKE